MIFLQSTNLPALGEGSRSHRGVSSRKVLNAAAQAIVNGLCAGSQSLAKYDQHIVECIFSFAYSRADWKLFLFKETVRQGRCMRFEDVIEVIELSSEPNLKLHPDAVEDRLELLLICAKATKSLKGQCHRLICDYEEIRRGQEFKRVRDAPSMEYGVSITAADLVGFFYLMTTADLPRVINEDSLSMREALLTITNKTFNQAKEVYKRFLNCMAENNEKKYYWQMVLDEINGMGALLVAKWLREYCSRLGVDKFRRSIVKTLPPYDHWFPSPPSFSCAVCHRNICDPDDHCPRRRAERCFTLASFEHPRFKPLSAFQAEMRTDPLKYIPAIACRLYKDSELDRVKGGIKRRLSVTQSNKRQKFYHETHQFSSPSDLLKDLREAPNYHVTKDPLKRTPGDLEVSSWLHELQTQVRDNHPFRPEREAGWAKLFPRNPLAELESLHVVDFLLLPNFSTEFEKIQTCVCKPRGPWWRGASIQTCG